MATNFNVTCEAGAAAGADGDPGTMVNGKAGADAACETSVTGRRARGTAGAAARSEVEIDTDALAGHRHRR